MFIVQSHSVAVLVSSYLLAGCFILAICEARYYYVYHTASLKEAESEVASV